MNKRARNRLIGVTAIIILGVVALLASGAFGGNTAYHKSVAEASEDKALEGERVKVGGTVVTGSWDKKSNPMTFEIRDENDDEGSGPTLKVVYNGSVPSTFGDGVVAIVTGDMESGQITADEMITKCPSKYESAEGAMPINDLPEGQELDDLTATGYVKAGSIVPPGGGTRFIVTGEKDGGREVPVKFDGAIPEGMVDGSAVVIKGNYLANGTFEAAEVALAK